MPSHLFPRREFLAASLSLPLAGLGMTAIRGSEPGQPGWKNNETIKQARQAALDILKPSAKDLERGLALHAESLVFDAYGFSPRAAIDGDLYRRQAEAGASDDELQDLREDMMMTRWAIVPAEREEYLQAWEASGVTCVFQNAGEEGQDPIRLLKRLARFTYATDMLRDEVSKAATPDEIEAAKKAGKSKRGLTRLPKSNKR